MAICRQRLHTTRRLPSRSHNKPWRERDWVRSLWQRAISIVVYGSSRQSQRRMVRRAKQISR